MKSLFPTAVLRESFLLLKSRSGLILLLINVLFFLLFGLLTLVSSILILGPAALLMKNPHILSGVLVFFLMLLFIEMVIAFVIFEQFVILVALMRTYDHQKPMISLDVLRSEGGRFGLYLKSCLFALLKICVGLFMFIVPGIQAFVKYLMVGPIAIFEYGENKRSSQILEKSEEITRGHILHLFSFVLALFLTALLLNYLLGRVFTQLVMFPVLMTYFTLGVVVYYKRVLNQG